MSFVSIQIRPYTGRRKAGDHLKTSTTRTKFNTAKRNIDKPTFDGFVFDSKDEAEFYLYLKSISVLEITKVHPRYELQPSFTKEGKKRLPVFYEADFEIKKGDATIVYDFKGIPTETADLKRKMFDFKYPELRLVWISRSKKHGRSGGWIDYDELKKIRSHEKRKRKAIISGKLK